MSEITGTTGLEATKLVYLDMRDLAMHGMHDMHDLHRRLYTTMAQSKQIKVTLKGHCPRRKNEILLNWIKLRFYRAKPGAYPGKTKSVVCKKVQDYKDGSGLQFINFDFVTGSQEINVSIPAKF